MTEHNFIIILIKHALSSVKLLRFLHDDIPNRYLLFPFQWISNYVNSSCMREKILGNGIRTMSLYKGSALSHPFFLIERAILVFLFTLVQFSGAICVCTGYGVSKMRLPICSCFIEVAPLLAVRARA